MISAMLWGFLIVISGTSIVHASPPKCGLYGAPPCVYVPAPPGHTPSCASPGKTYCENILQYPKQIVHNLLHHYGHDLHKLLVDEIADDFNANTALFHRPGVFGPDFHNHHYFPPNAGPASYPTASTTYYPQPTSGYNAGGYQYPKPNQLHSGYDYTPPQKADPVFIPKQSNSYNKRYTPNNNQRYVYAVQRVSEYNPAETFKRYARDLSRKTSPALIQEKLNNLEDAVNLESSASNSGRSEFLDFIALATNRTRTKRQSSGREALCEVNTQFIMPQAALNNQGNWMYVINQNSQAKQLVKAETCASSECSKLCQLPLTYRSRCEQKFIQKRLIALNADGQSFYTDTFWFPSCCVCTISNL